MEHLPFTLTRLRPSSYSALTRLRPSSYSALTRLSLSALNPASTRQARVPAATVEAWIAAGEHLEPRRLIPALMRYSSPEGGAEKEDGRREAIRYLEHAIHALAPQDSKHPNS